MQIISNFSSSQDNFLDDRQRWASKSALEANNSVIMPNGFRAFCVSEGKWYKLSTSDPKDFTKYTWTEDISAVDAELQSITQNDMDALFEDEEESNP